MLLHRVSILVPPAGEITGSLDRLLPFRVRPQMQVAVSWHLLKYLQMEELPGDRLLSMPLIKTITWTYSWVPEAQGNATIKVRGTDDSGNSGISADEINVTIGPDVCPCTIFPPGSLPLSSLWIMITRQSK